MKIKISLILCVPLIVGCLAEIAHSNPKYGGTVVVAVSGDPAGLNPAITTQGGVHLICASIFSGLVAHDFNLNPVPDLAERWEVSPDGRTYTFHLAPEALFHDGVPVTSADIKFTFEELLMKFNFRSNEATTLTLLGEASEKLGEKKDALEQYSQAQAIWKALNEQSREAEMKTRITRLSEQ